MQADPPSEHRASKKSSGSGSSSSQIDSGKVKGVVQMVAGAAVAAAGVPLCVLPGPGLAVIAGGAALASKGQRAFSGREPTKVERKFDAAAEKLGDAAKREAAKAAKTVAREAPVVAEKAACAAGKGVVAAAKAGGKLAVAGGKTVARKLRDARHDGVR